MSDVFDAAYWRRVDQGWDPRGSVAVERPIFELQEDQKLKESVWEEYAAHWPTPLSKHEVAAYVRIETRDVDGRWCEEWVQL